jgi:hypothetical protein
MMELGKKYKSCASTIEEVVFIRQGVAYCASHQDRVQTLYGWDAETGQSLSLGAKYDIEKTVILCEAQP